MVSKTVGYQGGISFDSTKLDGAPRKLISSRRLNQLGWNPKVNLEAGLDITYREMLSRGGRSGVSPNLL